MAQIQESRGNKRVEFFNIPMGECEIRPVWVFSTGRSETSICGVVINMSKSGIQILTEAAQPILATHFKISFILDNLTSGLPLSDCFLRRVWTENRTSMQVCSGFQFVGQLPESVFELLESENHHVRPFLRCEIDAVDPSDLT